MLDLLLKFNDQEIAVDCDSFIVGRHSECNLSIIDGRLSREHLKIERFGDIFVASDLGSSNGTKINDEKLEEPLALKNGDKINLGGLEILAEFSTDDPENADPSGTGAPDQNGDGTEKDPAKAGLSSSASGTSQVSSASASSETNSAPKALFFIAPICAFIIVVMVVGALIMFGRKNNEINKTDSGFIYSHDKNDPTDDDDGDVNSKKNPTPNPTSSPGKSNVYNSSDPAGGTSSPDNTDVSPTPKNQADTTKIETNSASFLRKISQNDPKAFLTSEQAQAINAKIKQFGNSPDLADNIKSARTNAVQIQALANSKNLKPQFVAVAALAKLGNSRGNVLQAAQGMADILDKLSIQLGSELADDSLLTIAVYDQGAAGDFLKTRNMLQDLSNKFPESSRTIRTIWFLRKNNKISDAEFDFALRFLAIGTITQNPKDFSVNAEELKLN